MDLAGLVVSTIIVSVSGALSPGPLTASAVLVGTRRFAKGGFLIAFGHMLFEFPYIILIALLSSPIGFILENPSLNYALTLVILLFILFFSYLTIRDGLGIIRSGVYEIKRSRRDTLNPILVGILLTGLNPYFLLWWLSVGLPLIRLSINMGFIFLLLMYVSHIWMDYLWLTLMGFAGESGAKILKSKGYGILLILLGVILALFAVDISLKTFLNFSLLPF